MKPDNLLLFSDGRLRLTDFGISKVAHRTISASGAGTVGYMAPEQAMGRPSRRSDVFATGLVLWQMFSGQLPEWPFEWPLAGYDQVAAVAAPGHDRAAEAGARNEAEPSLRGRRPDAGRLFAREAESAAPSTQRRRGREDEAAHEARIGRKSASSSFCGSSAASWKPISNATTATGPFPNPCRPAPGAATARKVLREETTFPACCPRCHRGMKLDWHYCPWCYGPGFEDVSERHYSDRRYVARCRNSEVRSQGPDAVHALLPLVPHQGAPGVEDRRQHRHVPQMRLGRPPRFLDPLPLVRRGPVTCEPGRPLG